MRWDGVCCPCELQAPTDTSDKNGPKRAPCHHLTCLISTALFFVVLLLCYFPCIRFYFRSCTLHFPCVVPVCFIVFRRFVVLALYINLIWDVLFLCFLPCFVLFLFFLFFWGALEHRRNCPFLKVLLYCFVDFCRFFFLFLSFLLLALLEHRRNRATPSCRRNSMSRSRASRRSLSWKKTGDGFSERTTTSCAGS